MERNKGFILKVLITFLLLAILFSKLDYREVSSILGSLGQIPLFLSILLVLAAVVLSAYKWQLLLAVRGWNLSMATLTRVYFVGLFMNNFLPSSIGGDVMRIYQVGRKINNHSEAAASVILERVLATVGLALPALIALVPNRQLLGTYTYVVLAFFLFCLTLVYVITRPTIFRPLARFPLKWWIKVVEKLKEIQSIIRSYSTKPGAIIKVVFYSVLFQFTVVLINFFLLKAMAIDEVSLWHCTLLVPIISAVSMIPVSVNGLGVREGAYVLLFGPLGLSASQAVTLSLLFFIIVSAVSLLGGLLFLAERNRGDYAVGR